MTDNEILKAEKVIKNLHAYCFCSQSVFKKMGYNFTEADFDYLYNLIYIIKKQNEEIEMLEKEIEEVNESDRESELQTLKENKENAKLFCEAISYTKFKVIKEFAERLKESLDEKADPIDDYDIEKLVKEVTEVLE